MSSKTITIELYRNVNFLDTSLKLEHFLITYKHRTKAQRTLLYLIFLLILHLD